MTTLSPKYTSSLADGIYDISSIITRDDFISEYKSDMELLSSDFKLGTTGAGFIKKPSVLALFTKGIGAYQGQAFLIFKGTASLYDALTDANTGIKSSKTGLHVHQGFQDAFDSVFVELNKFTLNLKDISVVHCIGHSLGGAIATLAADWIKSSGIVAEVKLYTFGSPRVGLELFAQKFTTKIGAHNIFRVYHKTDPVPMLPTWPFYHVPSGFGDYLINSPITGVPWEYHFMKHYIKSADKFNDWKLIKSNRPKYFEEKAIEQWLMSDGLISLSQNTLELMDAALIFVLKKVAQAGGVIIVGIFATTFTLLDRLAYIMHKAVEISQNIGQWIYVFIKKIASIIGFIVNKETSLTVDLIRLIFIMVHKKINEMIYGLRNNSDL